MSRDPKADKAEEDYRFAERVAILSDGGPITAAMRAIAQQEKEDRRMELWMAAAHENDRV